MRCEGMRGSWLSLLLMIVGLLAGCGGGSSGSGSDTTSTTNIGTGNVQPVTVAVGPSNAVNLLFTR